MKSNQATVDVLFIAFKSLKITDRKAFIEKVVSDSQMMEEFVDIALIEGAKKVKGKAVSAKEYFEKRREERKAP